ncbi:RNA-binding protein, putative [Plasmodium relictum]|uniref:RNA-binding protein, putative n=1 Tax=Plasmodium relictum TaxID=85471 RepID=A0A1J1H7N6_PLARL|nr:RNA-binding protein, putative [Plasmodium relictum]CRH00976.1 RNA-binding protein, putative [Plasmodium relictum]
MREFKKHYDEHHKKRYYRSYDKYNSNKNDEYRTNYHRRINKYNGKNSYNNYDERKKDNERNNHIRVKISNLDYTISKNDLVELFSNVCKVVNAWINYDHTDRSNGTAVCIFENINDAQKAIDKYDGSEIEGLSMKMEIMHRKNYSYKKKHKSRCPW